jgi:hypothetical protein
MGIITRPRDISDPFYRSTSHDYTHAYDTIVRAARSGHRASSSSHSSSSAPVLLLVSTDIDAICAAKTLVSLLSDDDVPYKLCPVDGYSTLAKIVEDDVETNHEVSCVFISRLKTRLLIFSSRSCIQSFFSTWDQYCLSPTSLLQHQIQCQALTFYPTIAIFTS